MSDPSIWDLLRQARRIQADQAFRIDEASSTVTYIGYAAPGSSEASAVWQIRRITVTGSITEQELADGDSSFDNVWDDRASLSYS